MKTNAPNVLLLVPNPSFCAGKSDGNFESPFNIHDFVQCSNGRPYCQSCWPHDLEFSEQCNQCLYNKAGRYPFCIKFIVSLIVLYYLLYTVKKEILILVVTS